MERRKIVPVLYAVLLCAVVFLGLYLYTIYRNIYYLPDESREDLCGILEASDIHVDPTLIRLKRERGTVYVCDSEGYNATAAVNLGQSNIKYQFTTPEGELIFLHNDALCEFSSGFFFRYRADQNISYTDGIMDEEDGADRSLLTPEESEDARTLVKEFMERGSSGFDQQDKLDIVTEITRVYEKQDVFFVECVRTIDGLEIAGNRVVCAVKDGVVAEAVGTWCFLTLGESYSAQLTDLFNIMFSVKKEIEELRETEADGRVTVEAVDRCYTLRYLGGDEGICFIPCWKIVTDLYGEFIYNAVDGTLCTNAGA